MFNIKEELKKLPEKPGVYIMKDKDDNIIYVGKAIILKNRVRQYFQKTPKTARIQKMVSLIDHFEYIVVDSEMEALILECNLIKLHRPKYNVLLKDDKMYPYIKITLNEDFPTVRITRKKFNDGAKYYGPYTNAFAVKETVDFLNRVFMLKQCRKIFKKPESPCLNYHIKRCIGACRGEISKAEYAEIINQVMMILDGKTDEIIKKIDNEMKTASKNLDYEKAAMLRDKKISIETLSQRQKMDNFSENDIDVIGIVKDGDRAAIEVFKIRNSKMIAGENFILKYVGDNQEEELLENFMKQYYNDSNIPNKIMFKYESEEIELIKQWLLMTSGRKNIEFKVPKKGEKLKFIEMAERNAMIALQNKSTSNNNELIISSLKSVLHLDELPNRIESYDISNISGTSMVAGMVVFEGGRPSKNEYRRLKIKTVEGQDDVACMKEVLERRIKYLVSDEKSPFGEKPNLILMDGGINQIRAGKEIINKFNVSIPVYGMVKNDKHRTRALMDEDGNEIDISQNEPLFNFITYLQDEVHKTAIEYHRKVRDQKTTKSELDNIPGIGEKKKYALLKRFKSVSNIRKASVDELCLVDGINKKLAIEILQKLREKDD